MSFKSISALAILPLGLALQLCGCANSATPQLDARFGDAVRAARSAQVLNPEVPASTDPVLGLDGKSAVNALDRYQDSFKSPPKTFEILGIGGTTTSK